MSHFMEPIYLSSLTVGDLYHFDSLNRAVNLRPSTLQGTVLNVALFFSSEVMCFFVF